MNYLEKLWRLHAEGKFPKTGVWSAEIRHDDWCALLHDPNAPCNCDPDVRLVNLEETAEPL